MSSTVQTILRSTCVLTGTADIEQLYSFKNFPIYVGCVDSPDSSKDLFCNMNWGYSKSSGNVQLIDLLDPAMLYKQNHGSGTIGAIWNAHHKKFYSFISKYDFHRVLEIGGASGALIKNFLETDKDFNWTIIEPSDTQVVSDPRVTFINDFFENYQNEKKFDTIIHSHLFEHVYDPIKFLNKIYNTLEHAGNHFITLPNMKHWLDQGFTNTLLFEHTFYVDDQVLEYLLNKANFEVVDKIVEEHSIFIYCKKSNNVTTQNVTFNYVKDLYLKYISNLHNDFESILKQIGDSEVFLFGGHIFSQILLNLGLPENQVINILDNDPKKHKKRLYGSNLYIKSPLCLKGLNNPIVIVRGGTYTKEIIQSILNINPTARII